MEIIGKDGIRSFLAGDSESCTEPVIACMWHSTLGREALRGISINQGSATQLPEQTAPTRLTGFESWRTHHLS
jgi:hypothetical protein